MGKADRYRHLKYRRVSGAVVYRRLSLTRRAGGGDRRDPAAAGDAPRLVCRPVKRRTKNDRRLSNGIRSHYGMR